MALHESAEMYLETIYQLTKEKNSVRSIDIAEAMGYSKPSISRAVGLLKQGGYLVADEDGFLSLTELGSATAEKIFERHMILKMALHALGVSEETAEEDACKVEHILSDETFNAIKRHFEAYTK